MNQLALDWTPGAVLPVSGRTLGARHASASGAVFAAEHRGQLTLRYLALLWVGPMSDQQAARALGVGVSSINSVRDGCGPLVEPSGLFETVTWPRGGTTKRTRWGRAA